MTVLPDTAQELVDEVFLFGRALRLAIATSHEDPVPQGLMGVVFVLATRGECRQNELAWELCISQSALSRQIAELVDAGYIGRKPDPEDGRASLVRVTARGEELLRRSKDARAARLRNMLGHWSEADAVRALDSIRQLKHTLSDHAHRNQTVFGANHLGR